MSANGRRILLLAFFSLFCVLVITGETDCEFMIAPEDEFNELTVKGSANGVVAGYEFNELTVVDLGNSDIAENEFNEVSFSSLNRSNANGGRSELGSCGASMTGPLSKYNSDCVRSLSW